MTRRYIPSAGDIVWLEFNPQAGHRPALVVSPLSYNQKTGLMLCCPMTTKVKGYPFEVKEKTGAILADQVKNLDWLARKAKYKGKVTPTVLQETRQKLAALLEIKQK